jgi:hypothetical protein
MCFHTSLTKPKLEIENRFDADMGALDDYSLSIRCHY